MKDTRIILVVIWIVVMLIYLLGDVLRIFSGDFQAGQMEGMQATQMMYLGMAALMLMPILMIFLSLVLPQPVNRWANMIVSGLWFVFNAVGLPGYAGHYDKFLLAVSMIFNLVTIWYAWRWV